MTGHDLSLQEDGDKIANSIVVGYFALVGATTVLVGISELDPGMAFLTLVAAFLTMVLADVGIRYMVAHQMDVGGGIGATVSSGDD